VSPLRSFVPTPLRRLAAYLLPLPSRLSSPNVSDARHHRIRDGVTLDVYWLALSTDRGPAASLSVFGDEVMRFDCLGPGAGHMHLNLKQSRGLPNGGGARLYFREQLIDDQIERSLFEFENNLTYALKVNTSARRRRLRLSPDEINTAAGFLRDQMQRLWSEHGDPAARISAGAQPVKQTPGKLR